MTMKTVDKAVLSAGVGFFSFYPLNILAAESISTVEIIRNPIVEGILCAIILLSLLAEVKTAGFSGGALIAAFAGCVLIGANWSTGEEQILEFSLYFGGIALLIMDILFLFSGVAAAIGLVAVMTGLFFTLGGSLEALYVLSAALILAALGGYFLIGHLSESALWQRIVLRSKLTKKEGFVSSALQLSNYTDSEGIALSVLRPAGKVEVNGSVCDAVSEGSFIEKGQKVSVKKVEGNHLVVKLVSKDKQ